MRKIAVALALTAVAAGKLYATPPGFPITNSAHDFVTFRGTATGYTVGGNKVKAYNRCSTCHAAHRAKRNYPLWSREAPTTNSWIVWNGDQTGVAGNALSALHTNADGSAMTGQLLDVNNESTDASLISANNPTGMEYLSATELTTTGTGLCMSCHDGQTAVGYTSPGAVAAPWTGLRRHLGPRPVEYAPSRQVRAFRHGRLAGVADRRQRVLLVLRRHGTQADGRLHQLPLDALQQQHRHDPSFRSALLKLPRPVAFAKTPVSAGVFLDLIFPFEVVPLRLE